MLNALANILHFTFYILHSNNKTLRLEMSHSVCVVFYFIRRTS